MGVYTYINKDAKRGAAGAVPEMFWVHGRRPLDSAARLWYTGIGDPKRMASKGRGPSPRPFSYLQGVSLRGPSRPVDELGSDNLRDEHYLLVFVLREQLDPITHEIERYEQSLRDKGLPDIPLHSGLLLTGHEGYEGMPLADRKRLPSSFRVLFRNLPVRHVCAVLRLSEYGNIGHVKAAMRRSIANFLFDNLGYFQGFDDVKIYYDSGRRTMAHALHRAMGLARAKNAVVYRAAVPENYWLSQAADYICTMELVALRYRDGEPSATDKKFFGSWSQFKKGILREMRAKRV